jgi:hypothetical protein
MPHARRTTHDARRTTHDARRTITVVPDGHIFSDVRPLYRLRPGTSKAGADFAAISPHPTMLHHHFKREPKRLLQSYLLSLYCGGSNTHCGSVVCFGVPYAPINQHMHLLRCPTYAPGSTPVLLRSLASYFRPDRLRSAEEAFLSLPVYQE